ncbi:hypothetical protein IAU60_003025 [Kwoniella sp. DSM 27419]
MAHPLTQQPPSALPFAFAARPSPLSFGFGSPSAQPALGSPVRAPFGAGSWSTPSSSRSPIARFNSDLTGAGQNASLKRSRPSRSPSSSPPLTPSSPTSVSSQIRIDQANSRVDLAAVASLDIRETRPTAVLQDPRQTKKSRGSALPAQTPSDALDVGVLLASLPATAHLSILVDLLRAQPSLSSTVLAHIPRLELRDCIRELDVRMERVQRVAGSGTQASSASQLAVDRRWERVRGDVESFCHTAATYIRYITSANYKQAFTDTDALFPFLHAITAHVRPLLRLVPPSAPSSHPVFELAQMILSVWNNWISSISLDVNENGGMFPYSTVSNWADAFEALTSTKTACSDSEFKQVFTPHWSTSLQPASNTGAETTFEASFIQALTLAQNRFNVELGWLIGRR